MRAAYVIETFERSQAALINLEEYRQFRQYMVEREAFFQQLEATAGRNAARNRDLTDNFTTLEELEAFWHTHSSADYEDMMESVEVTIDPSTSIVYCPVAKDLLRQVRTHARQQGVSAETLVNLWLQERLCTSG